MRRNNGLAAAAAIILCGMGSAASAADFSVGLGAALAPDYEGSDDAKAVPLWSIRASALYHPETYVSLVGTELRSNLVPHDHFRAGLIAKYLADYEDVDDSRVKRLNRPEAALQTGVTLGYDFVAGPMIDAVFEIDASYDALHGNGGLVTPRARYRTLLNQRWRLEGSISSSYASEDYMSNRFGIGSGDAGRSGLDQYNADDGFKDVSLAGSVTFMVTPNWSLTGLVGYARMIGDAEDSPIVEDRGSQDQAFTGAMVNYRF
ncbi:MipA/OmpV family protein [Geminicoccaceae bacterium 1502E]|nr:MipA/OmpV family protein [Geminicoccaceae bacterium 1502E]